MKLVKDKDTITSIPINEKLGRLGVTKFVKQGDLVQIIINRHKVVSFNIHRKDFQQTMDRFRESALNGTAGLSRDTVKDMELLLVHPDNDYVKYLQSNDNGNASSESCIENLKVTYATVFADKTSLYEAVIIDSVPFFAKVSIDSNEISLCTEILVDEDNAILPLPVNEYASRPYEFDSEKEFRKLEHLVRTIEDLDSLFQKVKAQWDLYIDNDTEHNIMCAADTIFTYNQDKFGTTHYDYFVGENDSGKTNNLHVFNLLGYRNIFTVDATAPNISQFLGSDRDGACTICEDEADDLDEDRDRLRIYKAGYITGIFVHRMDTTFGRVQLKLRTFGFKAFTAEGLPDARIAKGFIQRCIIFYCKAGNPTYDIVEVIKTGRDKKLEQLLNDFMKLRNLLLIYRLLHYYDEIPDLKLNIKNREKQLFKPTFRVFQKSGKALKEVTFAINKYLSEYRTRRSNTFNAALYKSVRDLIKREKTRVTIFTNLG